MTAKVTITSAENLSSDALCAAMNSAFSDYAVPMKLSPRAFDFMMQQRGLDRSASRVARVGIEIVAIWLVSVRASASYLISSGTDPSFRRQGLASRLAEDCLSGLKHLGIASFQTEVLTKNTNAFDLYTSLGMQVSRQLECYDLPNTAGRQAAPEIHETAWSKIRESVPALIEIAPSWQNDCASIDAIENNVKCQTVSDAKGLAAYAVFIPDNGTLAQIAVRPDCCRQGIAQALVQAAHPGKTLRLINVDSQSVAFHAFLSNLKAVKTVSQYELVMHLSP